MGKQAGRLATRQGRAGQVRTGQGRARHNQGNIDDELAKDCKHKEIIKGANEESNEGRQGGKLINNQVTRWVGSRQLT